MFTILVVDDEPYIRHFLKSMISKLCQEAQILEATDGQDALEKLKTNHVDLMTVDINMPYVNGYDLISFTRNLDQYMSLPIVVLTSQASEDASSRAKELGVMDFISKIDATEATLHNPLIRTVCRHMCPQGCPHQAF